ncbi:single-stranded DNA-binding protein [Streptomyces violaceusniger]|uniref:single-stranded DNA-binding protein n=1 Tax=Streptomyces violaceusniger TaxID=68280 RepID=UPI00382E3977
MLPTLNGTARLIEDPELRYGASGGAVVKVRLAFNSRKKDQSGQWQDDASFFITGTAFGQAAENIAATLQRGMEVVVSGRMKTDSWESKEGEKKSAPSLLLDSVGPSLRFATARVEKAGGSGQGRQEFQQARGAQQGGQSGDPWASQAPASSGGGGWGASGGDEPPPF